MKKFKDYLQAISRLNGLGNGLSIQWLFYSGMLFSSRDKWWGDWLYRPQAHEGIDICWYRFSGETKTNCFDPLVKIPAMDQGIILNVCDDFLGKTLVLKCPNAGERTVVYTYAHVTPEKNFKKGTLIEKNDTIARVCPTHKNPQLPPHLHFSCFEILNIAKGQTLDWNLFADPQKVNMIHPVFL